MDGVGGRRKRIVGSEVGPGSTADKELEFAALIERQLDRSYRIARLILRDEADAEDATHDAVMAAWQHWRRLKDPDRFDAWFGRILVNRCRDRLRRRARARQVPAPPPEAGPSPEGEVERRAELAHAFEALNEDQRIAVVLRYWADLTVEEIAERVSAPAGTVKSRLHHAMDRMRSALEPSEETR